MNKLRFSAEIMEPREAGSRRRDMVIYSGAPVYRFNFWTGEEYYIVLGTGAGEVDIDRLKNAPLTLNHDRSIDATVGVFERAWLDGGRLLGTARFAETPDVEGVWQKVEQGIIRNVSVEASFTGKAEKTKDKIDGLPVYRVPRWTPEAVSLVAVGADRHAVLMHSVDFDGEALREMVRTVARGETAAARDEVDAAGSTRKPLMARREPLGLNSGLAGDRRFAVNKRELMKLRAALALECDTLLAAINDGTAAEEQIARSVSVAAELETCDGRLAAMAEAEAKLLATARRSPAVVRNNEEEKPWTSFGEFLHTIARDPSGHRDARLVKLAASGHSEGIGSDGGFLVEKQFVAEVMQNVWAGGSIVSRCRVLPIGPNSNGVRLPGIDETSRASGSRWGGVQAYWAAEADTIAASKSKFRRIELELRKLTALTYVTDELLADATVLGSFVSSVLPQEIVFKLEDAIVNGTGAGMPLGLMNSGALVTVAAEGSQVADTVNEKNVLKMFARLPLSSRATAAWLINQDVEPQLPQMVIGQQPVYLPPGGLVGTQPYGTLLGRPVIPVEFCSSVGDLGDIVLADLSQYILARKGGLQADTSIHVKFTTDEQAFRFIMRVDGQPAWSSAITPYKGSSTLSPYITLAAR